MSFIVKCNVFFSLYWQDTDQVGFSRYEPADQRLFWAQHGRREPGDVARPVHGQWIKARGEGQGQGPPLDYSPIYPAIEDNLAPSAPPL